VSSGTFRVWERPVIAGTGADRIVTGLGFDPKK
jgi:hypothetical protein